MDYKAFARLVEEAHGCALCPRMGSRTAVLSELNGSLTPLILFVAEAPGRKGADRTRIPMTGDASGAAFDALLESVGIGRDRIFITNAVMCSPRSESDANRAPMASEVSNCNPFLRRTIETLNPPLVVTLGSVALGALDRVEPHGLKLASDSGTLVKWLGRSMIPMYHPSPQVLISRRNLDQQKADWEAIREWLARNPKLNPLPRT